ncbi:MAG: histidine phosphatase family protein [Acidiferrobacterales bacterium]|nr:histidine phosphatase family protein [Acidiferrobacterales bacterium]
MTQVKTTRCILLSACLLSICLLIAIQSSYADTAVTEKQLWNGVRNGTYIAIMRHALAPGVGDPEVFELEECGTQRNLSSEGLGQARRIGERFRINAIVTADVYSSQWCRCRDTASALKLGPVGDLKPLNSFFRNFEYRESQTLALLSWLRNRNTSQPTVLVTHQVNISALLGLGTTSGEIVFFYLDEAGSAVPVGSILTP